MNLKAQLAGVGLLPLLQTLFYISAIPVSVQAHYTNTTCKTTPNDAAWPSISEWTALNQSISGRLLHPSPPAAACHSPTFDNDTCNAINTAWTTFAFHQDNPVSSAWNNMNNDSCLPNITAPCSDVGYPVYVVNASDANDIKSAIDFAREKNIRLTVKASGHDYLKRAVAPYSLLIWTRYMVGGYEFHDTFQPQGCNITIDTTAVTAGSGSYVSEMYSSLSPLNQTLVDGMGKEVTLGGYITGGGHSPLSHIYGLGSDQVYEVEMVTPTGEIVTANECQNTDLFWAVRGGGGGTFGVLSRITVRTVPATPIALYDFTLQAASNSTTYFEAVAYFLAQLPTLSASNVSAFLYLYPDTAAGATFEAVLCLPDPASAILLEDLWAPYWAHVNETYAGQINSSATATLFPNLESLFLEYADTSKAGVDKVVGSWLLPPATLTEDTFQDALIDFLGTSGARLYMVSGKGVWDAVPRSGSDAVNPAWRKALIHAVTSINWTPLNETARALAEYNVNHVQTEALRQLVPDSGAYINEAYWDEPDFQRAFWGSNYERLLDIKKAVDPDDVLWCHICVGSEGWKEVGNNLCRV
ncbi:FAD-binding domain-containing protein [Mollisia scopiformis]|uniref:FAD-binding domain-containing protein n=1 Tax=Mollisia scopiformis TaxID=149040 RepID=A0A194X1E5_MOLSC|nr:FAD-binding domain-containing protein [Mollisia scopiformis]KUJ14021.1 FAD-binding domain-containing protein [Mollisia scopiformis]